MELSKKHYGPGSHPGTGTDQAVHAGGGAAAEASRRPAGGARKGAPGHAAGTGIGGAYLGVKRSQGFLSAMRDFEEKYHDSALEHVIALGPDGEILGEYSGDENSATITPGEARKLRRLTKNGKMAALVHNHPNGTPISYTDIRSAMELGFPDMIVVSDQVRYGMRSNGFMNDWDRTAGGARDKGAELGRSFLPIYSAAKEQMSLWENIEDRTDFHTMALHQAQEDLERAWSGSIQFTSEPSFMADLSARSLKYVTRSEPARGYNEDMLILDIDLPREGEFPIPVTPEELERLRHGGSIERNGQVYFSGDAWFDLYLPEDLENVVKKAAAGIADIVTLRSG